jgi:DNA adenine methylase
MCPEVIESAEKYEILAEKSNSYPFVKWAGGKTQIIERINHYFPTRFSRYFEPFLGGGAMYFYLTLQKTSRFPAFLSDTNHDLINAYKVVRDEVEELIKILKYHEVEYSKSPSKYYYQLRDRTKLDNVEGAARFIALNKTCYNGLYRVNRNGQFNVPMGRYKNPLICDSDNLRNVSSVLKHSSTRIYVSDYQKVLTDKTEEGDFIYLDPPYSPVSRTANFTGYTNTGFSMADQYQLAEIFNKLDNRGCIILLSNSNTRIIRELYKDYYLVEVEANRAINSKASKRVGHSELLIRNFK